MGSKKSGKRIVCTAQVHKTIVDALRAGAYKVHAAQAAGISRDTLDAWIAAGRAGDERFAAFARDVDQARAEDVLRHHGIISAAAQRGDWKAAAWLLERRYPKLYGKSAAERAAGNVDDVLHAAADSVDAADADDADAADGTPGRSRVHSPWLQVVR